MHGGVIIVLANVDQIQSILSHLPRDGAIKGVFLKRHFEYKSPYMLGNVHPNMVMVILWYLIETPLYKDLNVNIHHQWTSLFALHINSIFQFFIDNSDSNNEEIHCTPIDSMIH